MKTQLALLAMVATLCSCNLLGALVPDQDLSGDALGFDNKTSDVTLTDIATASVRLQAVGASGTISGNFDDLEPLASGSPVPTKFIVRPRGRRMAFSTCSATPKDFYNITFGNFNLVLKDRVGQANERSYSLQNNEPITIKFVKQPSGEYIPESNDFISAGTAFALVWTDITPIVTKENGINTPNTGQLSYKVSTDDNSLKNCVIRFTFGTAKGTISFK